MNRLELYKRRKRSKRLFAVTILLSLAILVVGILTVDHTVNSMLGINEELSIASIVKTGDSIYTLQFMNSEGKINLSYVKEDYNHIIATINKYYEKAGDYIARIGDYTKAVTNTK